MTTVMSTSKNKEKAKDAGVSFIPSQLREIDQIRGDTSRSLWLRRAAAKELGRLKNERNRK